MSRRRRTRTIDAAPDGRIQGMSASAAWLDETAHYTWPRSSSMTDTTLDLDAIRHRYQDKQTSHRLLTTDNNPGQAIAKLQAYAVRAAASADDVPALLTTIDAAIAQERQRITDALERFRDRLPVAEDWAEAIEAINDCIHIVNTQQPTPGPTPRAHNEQQETH